MQLEDAMKERRSIRRFQKKAVPLALIREVLETVLWAPSGMNRQDWELVVVQGEQRHRLAEVVAGAREHVLPRLKALFPEKIIDVTLQFFKNFGHAPVIVLVYMAEYEPGFEKGMTREAQYHAEYDRYNNLLSAAALIQNLLLAAHAKGLGTCWMTGPKYVERQISELVGKTGKELVSVIPMGYPDQSPPAPPRKENVIRWIGFH